MDTEYDFLTPEFLHLIFFKQKSLVIFPHVDLKHLRALEAFTVGYNLIDLEATALYNIREMVKSDAESYSQTPNYHLIYGLDKAKATQLIDLEGAHAILNVNQNCADLIDSAYEGFVFYNKKSSKFLNYDFTHKDLKTEKMILSLAKSHEMIRDELQKIKATATKIYTTLNNNPSALNLDEIMDDYTLHEQEKIIEFTENYYDIIFPEDSDLPAPTQSSRPETPKQTPTANPAFDFTSEFDIIKNQNKHIFQIFINELDEYRQKKVNESILDLKDIFMPNKLYNYLRRHHWSDAIPEDFLIQWKQSLTKNGGLSHEERVDFEMILRGLNITNTIIDNIINGEREDLKQKSKNIPQQEQVSSDAIPSVSDFSEFKAWMLKRIEYIEKKLKNQ